MYAVQLVGMYERCTSRPDRCCPARDSNRKRPAHHQKKLFVLVLVRGVWLASRSQCCFVHFQMAVRMGDAVEDKPGLVLSILLYR